MIMIEDKNSRLSLSVQHKTLLLFLTLRWRSLKIQ